MKVTPAEPSYPAAYATRVQKVASQAGVSEGQAAVELIQNAEVRPPDSDEKGTHVNTVA